MGANHPWQLFPSDLILYALDHLHRPSEFDQIVGFLLLDVGVETLFKVFLMLPDKVIKTTMSYKERKAAAEAQGFHELVKGVETAAKTAGDRLKGINLGHVEYFHGLRNKLYHAGNGITVQGEHAEQYASIAMDLLDRLLGVDLQSSWQEQLRKQKELDDLKEQVEQVKASLRKQMHALEQDLRLAIEKVEPAFVMPSFEQGMEEWRNGGDIWIDPKFFDIIATVESGDEIPPGGDLIEHSEDGEIRVEKFKSSELRKLMPPVLEQFVDKHNVEMSVMAGLLTSDDFVELLLTVADIAFELSTSPSANTYSLARSYMGGLPWDEDESATDYWTKMSSFGEDLAGEMQEIHNALKEASGLGQTR
ncbi:MAG: hypothetical protein ISS49_13010 [Anaerolineae bacterium]|nr:hypothetical protein [Anaerolineae bacterium]